MKCNKLNKFTHCECCTTTILLSLYIFHSVRCQFLLEMFYPKVNQVTWMRVEITFNCNRTHKRISSFSYRWQHV